MIMFFFGYFFILTYYNTLMKQQALKLCVDMDSRQNIFSVSICLC